MLALKYMMLIVDPPKIHLREILYLYIWTQYKLLICVINHSLQKARIAHKISLGNNRNCTCLLPGMQSDHIIINFPVVHFLVEQRENHLSFVLVTPQIFSITMLIGGFKFL